MLELSLQLRSRSGLAFGGVRLAAQEFGDRHFQSGGVVDDILTKTKGKLTKVSSSVSATEYTGFDIMGRVTSSKRTTDGVEYGGVANPMTYAYNLSGALIEQKYPSGRVVKNVLESDGNLSLVQSKKNANVGFFTYANSFTYTAAGAVTLMQLDNGKRESTTFDSRLHLEQIALLRLQMACTGQNRLRQRAARTR